MTKKYTKIGGLIATMSLIMLVPVGGADHGGDHETADATVDGGDGLCEVHADAWWEEGTTGFWRPKGYHRAEYHGTNVACAAEGILETLFRGEVDLCLIPDRRGGETLAPDCFTSAQQEQGCDWVRATTRSTATLEGVTTDYLPNPAC